MSDAIVGTALGTRVADEYVPAGVDAYELNKLLPAVSIDGDVDREGDHAVPVRTEMLSWEQIEKHFIVHATASERLVVRLFNYPAWTVLVNGEPVRTETTDITGLIVIPVAAGDSDVRIFFRTTTDRKIGVVFFLVSVLILLVLWRQSARASMNPPRILIATSNSGKIRDFAGVAAPYGISIERIANFSSLAPVVEDGVTFEENARKKAEGYSLAAPGEIVLADDSGLEIDALGRPANRVSDRGPSEQARHRGEKFKEWADTKGLTMLLGGSNSGVSLAMARSPGKEDRLLRHRRRGRVADRQGLQRLHDPLRLRHDRARQRHGEDDRRKGGKNWFSSPPTTPSAPSFRPRPPTSSRPAAARWSARCGCRSRPRTSRPTSSRRKGPGRRWSASPTPAATSAIRSKPRTSSASPRR